MTTIRQSLSLADALVRVAHAVDRVFAGVARDHELTPQQTQLICMLDGGPLGMRELGRILHLEKSSLSGLVDRVERRGLVTRLPDEEDRRAYYVALTEPGAELAAKSHDQVGARIEALADQLSPAERDQLVAIVTKIVAGDDAR